MARSPYEKSFTPYVPIEGGNHAQFGWYGTQKGDLSPEVSHLDQQVQTVAATVQMLRQIEARKGGKDNNLINEGGG